MKSYIEIPILNNEYKVIVCFGDEVLVCKVLARWHHNLKDVEEKLLGNRGICLLNPECHPVIALPSIPKTAEQIGTLAHEACHAVEHIFTYLGQPLNGELFAHSVGAVVRESLSSLTKTKRITIMR